AKLSGGNFFSFTFEVCNLACDQLAAAGGLGNFVNQDIRWIARSRRRFSSNLKRERQERIACKDGDAIAEYLVAGRLSAPEIIVVHARQIVVNERVGMDALD